MVGAEQPGNVAPAAPVSTIRDQGDMAGCDSRGSPSRRSCPLRASGGSIDEGLRILIPKWEGGTAHQRKEDRYWTQILNPNSS